MPAVPNVPGVPPLTSYSANNVELLVADSLIAVGSISSLFSPSWGIYSGGMPVITPASILSNAAGTILAEVADIAALIGLPNIVPSIASTVEFEFSGDSPISNYPQEQGAFQAYDKVQLPATIGLTLCCSGAPSQRQAFINTLQALRTSLALLDIKTPEMVFSNYNLIHFDFVRTADRGATMIVANCKFQLVPITAQATPGQSVGTTSIDNPQSPASASPQGLGNVQPQTAFQSSLNQFGLNQFSTSDIF